MNDVERRKILELEVRVRALGNRVQKNLLSEQGGGDVLNKIRNESVREELKDIAEELESLAS